MITDIIAKRKVDKILAELLEKNKDRDENDDAPGGDEDD